MYVWQQYFHNNGQTGLSYMCVMMYTHACFLFVLSSSEEVEELKRHSHTMVGSESVDYGGEARGQKVEAELTAAEVKHLETKVSVHVYTYIQ